MTDIIYSALIIVAVIVGTASIIYFYFSTDIFADILKRPLKMISGGMLAINVGIVLISYMTYRSNKGVEIDFLGIPLSIIFYVLYFVGSFMIIFGSRKFTRHS